MIVGRIGRNTALLAFRISNIKPTALEKALQGLKTIVVPPVTLHNKPNKQTLFRTA